MANKNFYLKYNITPYDKAINKVINSGIKDINKGVKSTAKAARKAFKEIKKAQKKSLQAKRAKQRALTRKLNTKRIIKKSMATDTEPKQLKGHEATDTLGRIQETMAYIQDNKNINRDITLSAKIQQAMRYAIGDKKYKFKQGDPNTNEFWEILPSWDGDPNSLISNVKWKKLPTDPKAIKLLEQIAKSKWGSEAQHQKYLDKAYHTGYKNFTNDYLNLKASDDILEQLESLMYSSEMWYYLGAGNADYDSDQGAKKWEETFKSMKKLITKAGSKLEQSDLDDIVREIKNDHTPETQRVQRLQTMVNKALKSYR